MNDYIEAIEAEFLRNANPEIARQQIEYLRNKFDAYGLKTPIRREVQKPFLVKEFLPSKGNLEHLVKILLAKPQREYHYFAQELVQKYIKLCEKEDMVLFEYMVQTNSWWDTVDFIAVKLMAPYFAKFPATRKNYVVVWLASEDIWLQRCALLIQLNDKENMDRELLSYIIIYLLGSQEFFINKAIGWVLRNYSKTDPDWVIAFVKSTDLEPLSRYEALRLLK